jgi:hypothetical protein
MTTRYAVDAIVTDLVASFSPLRSKNQIIQTKVTTGQGTVSSVAAGAVVESAH